MRYLKRIMTSLGVLLLLALVAVVALHRNRQIATSIWINRPPSDVWRVLTATIEYPEWNPMISRINGELREGSIIEVDLGSPVSDSTAFHPTVLVVQPDRELRWLGHVGITGIFDGEHRFQLEASGTGTRLVQSERFSGGLVGRLTDPLLDDTLDQMKAMNLALKQRVEAVPH